MVKIEFKDYPEFTPDYSPAEMFRSGVFGGAYFNTKKYTLSQGDDIPLTNQLNYLLNELNTEGEHINFRKYLFNKENFSLNKYGVECGSTYEDWKNRGWIFDVDPFGWFNWYINFYYGRRHDCDEIQVKRWKSFKARHGSQLKKRLDNKNPNKFLKTKQNLLHWAINWENAI